jgi:hypothetical protein
LRTKSGLVGRISSASPQLGGGGKGQGARAAPGRPGPTQPRPPGAPRAAPGGSKRRAGQRQTAKASDNKSRAPLRLKMSQQNARRQIHSPPPAVVDAKLWALARACASPLASVRYVASPPIVPATPPEAWISGPNSAQPVFSPDNVSSVATPLACDTPLESQDQEEDVQVSGYDQR